MKIDVTDFFKESEIKSIVGEELLGKTLILDPSVIVKSHRVKKTLLWKATGGFGCTPNKMGRAVFATCIGNGYKARWDRNDFVGEYVGELS